MRRGAPAVPRRPSRRRPSVRAAPCGARLAAPLACLLSALLVSLAPAQVLPDAVFPDLHPEFVGYLCPPSTSPPVARTDAERARFEMRARYRTVMPAFYAKVGVEPATVLLMPVDGVRVAQVVDTWQAPRGGGRFHDGQDIFAPRGTPVRAAAPGFVYRIDDLSLGGLSVTIIGDGFKRYFYTHFDAVPDELREGQYVTTDTVIGFVGTSGNAAGTPPHLHFGVYGGDPWACEWRALDPLPRLIDRD